MRLWSIHPKYLDSSGLVALWREALLAKKVLEGHTVGYKHHPQLTRFRRVKSPTDCINSYLSEVYKESLARRYSFDDSKIDWTFEIETIPVGSGQILYEWKHLLSKLEKRDHARFEEIKYLDYVDPHPVFLVVPGEIEDWEITSR